MKSLPLLPQFCLLATVLLGAHPARATDDPTPSAAIAAATTNGPALDPLSAAMRRSDSGRLKAMADKLHLTAEQQAKISAIMDQFAQKAAELRATHKFNLQSAAEIGKAKAAAIEAVLTAEQLLAQKTASTGGLSLAGLGLNAGTNAEGPTVIKTNPGPVVATTEALWKSAERVTTQQDTAQLKLLTEKLGINAEQVTKVKALYEQSLQEMKALLEKGQWNALASRDWTKTKNDALNALLTPEQQEKLKALRTAGKTAVRKPELETAVPAVPAKSSGKPPVE